MRSRITAIAAGAVEPPRLPPIAGVRLGAAESGVRYRGPARPAGRAARCRAPRSPVASPPPRRARRRSTGTGPIWNRHGPGVPRQCRQCQCLHRRGGHEDRRQRRGGARRPHRVPAGRGFVASTGVIGEPLDPALITAALPARSRPPPADSWRDAARGHHDHRHFSQACDVRLRNRRAAVTINGIAKGSGMIAPDMATMLAFLFTDAALPAPVLQALLSRSVAQSFNAITVDGDTSTSDTILLAATGQPARRCRASPIRPMRGSNLRPGARCGHARSGAPGGAGRRGRGEADRDHGDRRRGRRAARRIALAIGNSPLVKTAIAGADANWGRIVMAVGKSGEAADRDRLAIAIGGMSVARTACATPAMTKPRSCPICRARDRHRGRCRHRQGTGAGVDLRSHPPLYRHQWLLSQLTAPAARLVHRLLTLAWKSPRRSRP